MLQQKHGFNITAKTATHNIAPIPNSSRGTKFFGTQQTAINFFVDTNGNQLPIPVPIEINCALSMDPWTVEQLQSVVEDRHK